MPWPPLRVVEGGGKARPKRRNKQPEANLQASVVQYLERALPPEAGVWWSASMSGVRLPSARAKANAHAQGLRRGMFDLCFVPLKGPNAGETYWLELKADKGKLTDEQEALMNVMFPAGRGAEARSIDQVCAALVFWGFPIRCRV